MLTHWFIWKGKNSFADFGLWIRKLPKRTRARERYEEIEIPGRPGSLFLTEGEDVYAAYSDEMVVSCKNSINPDRLTEWLRGSGDLILSTDLSKARTARIANAVTFERDEKEKLLIGTIPFLFQPFRKAADETQHRVTFSASGTKTEAVYNPGDVAARPKLRLSDSTGALEITAGETRMVFEHRPPTLWVDCDAQLMTTIARTYNSSWYYYRGDYIKIAENSEEMLYRITKEGRGDNAEWELVGAAPERFEYIWQGTWSGEYLQIPVGSSGITVTGTADVTIDPQWRWL